MSQRLKDSVILKIVNEDCIYAMDCNAADDVYFKFNGPAKFFLEKLKEGKTEAEILTLTAENFTDCDPIQLKNDWNDFIKSIQEFQLSKD